MDTFDSVQWRSEDEDDDEADNPLHVNAPDTGDFNSNGGRPRSGDGPQAGEGADKIDLAGVGSGILETKVSDPQTENDGTKDAFVSYLVTTKVRGMSPSCV